MEETISSIQNDIFNYRFEQALDQTVKFLEKINNQSIIDTYEKRQFLNEVISMINLSIENKDYLLLSDILSYELKKLWNQ